MIGYMLVLFVGGSLYSTDNTVRTDGNLTYEECIAEGERQTHGHYENNPNFGKEKVISEGTWPDGKKWKIVDREDQRDTSNKMRYVSPKFDYYACVINKK